ncbi:MAG: nucleotidyltransferase domain-containing protein [Roseiflexaceae bacterium]|nr:nucleotidyltransferase domain-containing protein [Roseiflexaceae bacterium]
MTEQQQALEILCRRHHSVILYAFGSRASDVYAWIIGQQSVLAPGPSDVDIGVLIAPNISWTIRETLQFTLALEEFFGVTRVDLVLLAQADPFLAANVIRGERLFADDQHAADEYDLYVLRRAGDLIPLERERQDLIYRRVS